MANLSAKAESCPFWTSILAEIMFGLTMLGQADWDWIWLRLYPGSSAKDFDTFDFGTKCIACEDMWRRLLISPLSSSPCPAVLLIIAIIDFEHRWQPQQSNLILSLVTTTITSIQVDWTNQWGSRKSQIYITISKWQHSGWDWTYWFWSKGGIILGKSVQGGSKVDTRKGESQVWEAEAALSPVA